MTATTAPPPIRHPLGLPAGSVRALIVLMVVGLFWTLLLLPDKRAEIPLPLYFLLGLVLLFYTSHGATIAPAGEPAKSPLWLPRGTLRWFILLGMVGVVGWEYYKDERALMRRLTPHGDDFQQWPGLCISLAGGFMIGWIARLGSWRRAKWWQDIQAWVSMVAMLALAVEMIFHLFIRPTLEKDVNIDLALWESILVAIVAFYFGVRS